MMMERVAKRLDPSCEISWEYTPDYVEISHDGMQKRYEGTGQGTGDPIYTRFIEKTFRFDGTDLGFGTNPSIDVFRAKLLEYAAKSDEFSKTLNDSLRPIQ